MTGQVENWWVSVRDRNGDPGRTQLGQVWFEDGAITFVKFMGSDDLTRFHPRELADVRLIERVLPARRAAAAVDLLDQAWLDTSAATTANDIAEAIAILKGESQA